MTDISDLREGDEIEATIRMRLSDGYFKDSKGGVYPHYYLNDVANVTVVRPEIIPGQPYVDADGKLYVGRPNGRLLHVGANDVEWHKDGDDLPGYEPLPAGLRPAKVVPE